MTTTTTRAPVSAPGATSITHKLIVLLGPIGRPLAGTRWFPLWAVLRHTGRKSGTRYAIPIVALPSTDGFVIPLPFGEGTQWLRNVLAAGGGGIRWKGREYTVDRPEVVDLDDPVVAGAVPGPLRAASHRLGIGTWVSVHRSDEAAQRAGIIDTPANGGVDMETVTVVLNVAEQHVEAFEAGFREHEVPVWEDLKGRGLLVGATLNRLDISSRPVPGAVQYLVAAIFSTGEGHHAHDAHPGFEAWNKMADAYQVGEPLAFGGETVVQLGIESA